MPKTKEEILKVIVEFFDQSGEYFSDYGGRFKTNYCLDGDFDLDELAQKLSEFCQ